MRLRLVDFIFKVNQNWIEIEVNKLKEAEYNPRTISKDKLEQLKHSLTED